MTASTMLDNLKNRILGRVSAEPRRVVIDQSAPKIKSIHVDNYIKTSKYTILTFLPKNLYEQFRRIANMYFLLIVILSFTPISPNKPGGSLAGLFLVIGINAIKEAIEDFRRYQSDKEINNRPATLIKDGEEYCEKWKNIRVGDIVVVKNGEQFPADLVLLSSSNDVSQGMCYIETANLDGENNLKTKQALKETDSLQRTSDFVDFRAMMDYEAPGISLNQFIGKLTINNIEHPLSLDQLLIRSTKLMNTKWIYGVVVYTGHETKYMLNTMATPSKRSRMDQTVNHILICVFIIEAILCLISALIGYHYEKNGQDIWYLMPNQNYTINTVGRFFTFLVLYATIAPFSMYVSIEIVRVLQLVAISRDKNMYYAELDAYAKARTSNLNEELGQIEYIFSDKTGTLTRNQMEFRLCNINGAMYHGHKSEGGSHLEHSMKASQQSTALATSETALIHDQDGISLKKLSIDDSVAPMGSGSGAETAGGSEYDKVDMSKAVNIEFYIAMALCHTVVPDASSGSVKYSATSPDEAALVEECASAGVKLISRNQDIIVLEVLGESRSYKLLNTLEFSSDRKIMSVIVGNYNNNDEIILYCKGADSTIIANLIQSFDANLLQANHNALHEYSSQGLRTLCYAKRMISVEEYRQWNQDFQQARLSMEERDHRVSEVAIRIEKNLVMMGVVGIEDKLQDGVEDTIATLQRADIKIWMLTGDKQETAINIGVSCKLIGNHRILILNEPNTEALLAKMGHYINEVKAAPTTADGPEKFALVIDGHTLSLAIDHAVEEVFYNLASMVHSVVCCRVTPFQKAEVVRIVRDRTKGVTLAIGDGANDVSMIQRAHVGIGVIGFEGRQAVLASDYAIAQFRFLEQLVLVHGRYNYKRLSTLLCFSFWKNIATVLMQLWFNTHTQFSGQTYADDINNILINIIFTSFPIIIYAVTDKDINPLYVIKYPILFKETQEGKNFTWKIFMSWMVHGIYCSLVIYFFMSSIYIDGASSSSGLIGGLWTQACASFIALTLMIQIMMILVVNHWNKAQHWTTWVSITVFIIFQIAYSFAANMLGLGYYYMVFINLLKQPTFYLSLILVIIVCLLPVIMIVHINRTFFTQPLHVAQELARKERDGFLEDDEE
ncbi:hypothetical protein SAMD00019534_081280 [Acytostelium subglobosum LB1]|uniref:hypothetical protein n=1 Tax=Acytostelium subglobosum LB1 TaxID=1410327 RepID=UPI000644C9D6|nr:hypothetical protein SAMD00019534_081280 [Acytostelium subglobosum LB1]GAM24953.1 hypothetical protein SAMD00019534_081280 [Acytostelium subglobosum LB1]|eukprot:XP_012752042.1 hypothetical protein SAMD00019534_081280 [Acytostelium subglobosum LB1]